MRKAFAILSLISLALLAGCPSSDDGSSTDTLGTDATSAHNSIVPCGCADEAGYLDCMEAGCNDVLKAAYGPAWKAGTFTGTCMALFQCSDACNCNETCMTNCLGNASSDCKALMTPVATCSLSHLECAAKCP